MAEFQIFVFLDLGGLKAGYSSWYIITVLNEGGVFA